MSVAEIVSPKKEHVITFLWCVLSEPFQLQAFFVFPSEKRGYISVLDWKGTGLLMPAVLTAGPDRASKGRRKHGNSRKMGRGFSLQAHQKLSSTLQVIGPIGPTRAY